MANENIFGEVIILLELPDEGIPRIPPEGHPNIDTRKSDFEIVNEIIQQGVSVLGDWSSERIPGTEQTMAVLGLTYGGS